MKLSKIQELLRLVAESDVSEIEIEEDDFKLTIRQNSPQVFMQPAAAPAQSGYGAPPQWQQQGPPPASPQPHQAQAPQQPAQPQPSPGQPQPSGSGGAQSAAAGQAQGGAAQDGASSASAQEANENGAAGADTETAAEEYVVKAPIVGTFYEAPSPDSDPFVEVGDSVSEGDVLCIIEAMKLMNEIECETSGTIQEVLVEDAEPVEFDQPLFVIEED